MDVAGDFYRSAKGDQKDSRKVGYLLKNRIKNQRKSFFSLVKSVKCGIIKVPEKPMK